MRDPKQKGRIVSVNALETLFSALAGQMELYTPKRIGTHYAFAKHKPSSGTTVEFNNVRSFTPVKEFLFPLWERAATFPKEVKEGEIEPFGIFGLKDCDLRSIEILDKVFLEDDFADPSYMERREKLFIVSTDCFDPAESCCCTLFGGQPYAETGFDLNVSRLEGSFVVEAGSEKGTSFIDANSNLFGNVSEISLNERDKNRAKTRKEIERSNSEYELDAPVDEILEKGRDSDVFDVEAQKCVECQACTRICPTCHCFYLYDTEKKDYFAKMKMWDSCMRMAYAAVAGGANPRRVLGERMRHRLMHKYAYFMERYGVDMCVGCGRCIDADTHGMDFRVVLKKLNEELQARQKAEVPQ